MTNTRHRPELHITVDHGVLEAPAGALYTGTSWHVFYQYRRNLDRRNNHWGHVHAETTPFFWDTGADVLSTQGQEIQIRAGSVVAPVNANDADIFFTSVTETGPSIHVASISNLQTQPQVKRDGCAVGGEQDYRSPCVMPGWADENDRTEGHGGWLMLAVSGPMSAPKLVMLSSADRNKWNIDGELLFSGTSGLDDYSVLVSPRITRLRDEVDGHVYDVLMLTVESDGVDISGYLVGTLHGRVFHVKTPFTQMDFGHDFTRPRAINTPPGVTFSTGQRYDSALVFGLMNGVGRLDDPETHLSMCTEGWANCLSLPRLTTLQGGLLFQTPTPGVTTAVAQSRHALLWSGLIDAQQGAVTVNLLDGRGEVAARITHSGDHLTLDRSMNLHHIGDTPAEAFLIAADTDSLTIIVDGSTVEVFADGGVIAMSSRIYFTGMCSGFEVEAKDGAATLQIFEVAGTGAASAAKLSPKNE